LFANTRMGPETPLPNTVSPSSEKMPNKSLLLWSGRGGEKVGRESAGEKEDDGKKNGRREMKTVLFSLFGGHLHLLT
jgi:hypothetical protein